MTWRRAALAALTLCVLAVSVAVAPAGAQDVRLEPRGLPVEELPNDAPVEKFDIVGAKAVPEAAIKRRLYTEETSGLLFFRKVKRLDKEEFLLDLRRVVVFYQQNGYFDADVEGYGARETPDGGVELEIYVFEGEPSRVDTLRVETTEGEEATATEGGIEEGPEHEDPSEKDLLRDLSIHQGDVFNEARVDSAQAQIAAAYQNSGHAFAEVLKEYRIDKNAYSATVIFTVYPDSVYRFGQVRIEGETHVNQKLILGQVRFKPGELYRLDKVYDTQRRLYQLNLFRRVQVQPQYEQPVADSLPVVIHLVDAKEHLVRLGAGYGTEDFVRLSASWLDRNFLGGARQARVAGEYSSLRRGASVSLTQPSVLIDDLSATGTIFFSQDREDTYIVARTGGTARINHELSPSVRTFYGFNIERDDFTDFGDNREAIEDLLGQEFLNPSTLSYAEFGANLDTTDDIFSPTEGNTVSVNYHLALPTPGDYQYHRVTLLATHYQEVRRGWVLALKALPGIVRPFGGDEAENGVVEVPLFERLFAGGSTSVRGYQRRRLGPLAGAEGEPEEEFDPVGGELLLETSAELRFPLFGKIRGVGFLDAGNVWIEPGDFSFSELRYTPGVGIRYDTPVGPVRVDAGFKTRSEDPGPRMVLHLSIGNAF